MAACWCRQCGSLFFRHPNHSVTPASKTSKPKPQPSDIQTGHSTLRQNTFDKFPRSDFCGLSETSALMGICPKSLILSHFITLYFSTRDINTTVSTWVEAHIQILMPLSTFMETYPPEYHAQGNMSTGFYVQGNMSTGLHVRGNISTSWIVSIGFPLFCSAKEPE